MTLKIGKELIRGETSVSGAYGVIDRRKGKILRVALSREIAELLAADYQHRKVVETYVVPLDKKPLRSLESVPDASGIHQDV